MRFSYHPTTTIATLLIFMSPITLIKNGVKAQDFEAISGDIPQDTTRVILPPDCTGDGRVPETMFTFATSSDGTTKITAFPKDLITAESANSDLILKWTSDASLFERGGVRIEYPSDQLTGLGIHSSSEAQVLDGFTALANIEVSSSAEFRATITSLSNDTSLSVSVSSSADAYIKAPGATVSRVDVSSSADLDIEAMTVNDIQVSSSGDLKLKGNVVNGDISSSGDAIVDGDVTGTVSASSSGSLSVTGVISGSVKASSSADIVVASSCDNVSTETSAGCSVDDVDGVTVDVNEQPSILEGTVRCFRSSASHVPLGGSLLSLFTVFGLAMAFVV